MQTGQTIAVLSAGAIVGVRFGAASVCFYLLLGFAGLPVFSEGASGLQVMAGPSGGYLVGFVVATMAMGGWRSAGLMRSFITAVLGMLLGHAIILICGWFWMALLIGPYDAYANGIEPFYLGSLVKSVLAALLVVLIYHFVGNQQKAVFAE